MIRTSQRPLVKGFITPNQALGIGGALGIMGIGGILSYNLMAGIMGAAIWVGYLGIYTYMKRKS